MSAISCGESLKSERTPNRVLVDFLKAVGRGDYQRAGEFVVPDAHSSISTWASSLIFPDHAVPPTPQDEEQIDKFIGLFYRTTIDSQEETRVTLGLTYASTDALIQFPSVADNPMTPTSALFQVVLVREPIGTDGKFSDWKIESFGAKPMS